MPYCLATVSGKPSCWGAELHSHPAGFVATMSSLTRLQKTEWWGPESEGCLALQKQVVIAQQLGRKVQINTKSLAEKSKPMKHRDDKTGGVGSRG